ncbi:MAG: N-acetyl sugar amidotransferase [Thermoplasmata archaeon]|nr:N-acetyl sugar amidotransferase [Thermoplasmata archaeon]
MKDTPHVCSRCIMDTTVPDIEFDENGKCTYCKLHDLLEEKFPGGEEREQRLKNMVEEIKSRGKGKKYDCVVGVSGGCDSTYLIYWAKKVGIRPLAVHLDNGWNSEIAEENMRKAVEKLAVDIKTVQVDLEEFNDLQLAFLKASVPDVEVPTDIGIYSTLFRVAKEENIPSILNGHSFRTEGSVPRGWTYMDGTYIESVYKKHGKKKRLEHFDNLKITNLISYVFIRRIKEYRPLEYIDYDKKEAGQLLEKEVGWKDYGGHHYESIYTRFVASYLLLEKFGIDKRKVTLSARIRSGKMTREEALKKIGEKPYPIEKVQADKDYILGRFGINEEEFDDIMSAPPRSFHVYHTSYSTIHRLRFFIKIACKMGLLPDIIYEKYAK